MIPFLLWIFILKFTLLMYILPVIIYHINKIIFIINHVEYKINSIPLKHEVEGLVANS
jgi:hypothetical protein